MSSPYSSLPKSAFWRSVAERAPLDVGALYSPKFAVSKDMKIVTAGSCFAQHVGRTLKHAGYDVVDSEKLPPNTSDEVAKKYGYRLYSARYGNIYTVRQLKQITDECLGVFKPAHPVWEKEGRYYDAQRPNVEPDGLPSVGDVMAHRASHLARVKEAFQSADLFVFTFGLTEAWIDRETGTVYPMAPGTLAGEFDPEKYQFKNYGFEEIRDDFIEFRKYMMSVNPDIKFLITTSPVPLTATASGEHVEVATCYSKAVLRSVCGELNSLYGNVDYFPSFEVITSTNNRGIYFEANKRSVNSIGVEAAMRLFLQAHESPNEELTTNHGGDQVVEATKVSSSVDVVCEESLLEDFSR
jgi:hypothetical protein